MTTSEERLDRTLGEIVRSVSGPVPAGLEARIAAAAAARRPLKRRIPRRLGALALLPAAAAAGLAVVLSLPSSRRAPAAPIAEIRTELTIAGTDIKVIFFQKPDFRFYEEEPHAND